ncbi:MAG: outer membrane protein assembly factor BamA [Chlamydiae bacterium CG10_big_fil_rev_8_21_14_0_10_35_9]|nr:MAG: outer membrane protein assembly factor BamA [Chlamydiae bacterium CG10_big_fil_rev_8_21_14_0_10_35_9]
MHIRHKILLLLIVLASSGLFAIETFEGKNVANIDVTVEYSDPDAIYDTRTILTRLKTRKNEPFSQLNFDQDLKMLSDEYDRIEPYIKVDNDQIYIKLLLWPRPIIHSIQWQGNEQIKTKKLQKELDTKPLSVFNREEFNKKFNKVKEYYIKKGYFESQLSYTIEPIANTNQIDINITIDEGRSGKIKNVSLKGFSSKEKSEIREQIYTKKFNFLSSWLTGTGTYREEVLDQDKMSILNYLHNKGYADAQVDIQIIDDPSGKVTIEIVAEKGELYKFGDITFEGNTIFTNEEIQKRILISSDSNFSPEQLRETAQSIKDLYGQKGYIETNVYFDTHLSEQEPYYDVSFKIEEGKQYKIGLIRIFGNTQTNDNVILRESLLVPGELFDSRKLKATEMRLQGIGYFKNVNVYAVNSTDDLSLGPNYKDVYIEVEETATGNVSLFLGFSSTDNINGGLELTERNFNIAGFAHLFTQGPSALRGGGEYAHIRVNPGKRQNNYVISWMTPYVRDSLWRLGFELSKTSSQLQSKDYDIDTIGFSVFTSYPLTNYLSVGFKYRFRNAEADVVDKDSRPDKDLFGKNDGIISAASTYLSYDSTNSIYKPKKGLRSNLELEVAGLGGDFRFYKISFINTYYQYLWSKGTLKFRGDLKFIDPYGSQSKYRLSLSERFFLGGEYSVRGYKPYILGPQAASNEPLGGITSALLSAEYCQEVFKIMDAFAFIDAGSISFDRFSVAKLRAAYGVGVRLELMNRTPIMFGWGFPINPERSSDKRKFFFSMGGQF